MRHRALLGLVVVLLGTSRCTCEDELSSLKPEIQVTPAVIDMGRRDRRHGSHAILEDVADQLPDSQPAPDKALETRQRLALLNEKLGRQRLENQRIAVETAAAIMNWATRLHTPIPA